MSQAKKIERKVSSQTMAASNLPRRFECHVCARSEYIIKLLSFPYYKEMLSLLVYRETVMIIFMLAFYYTVSFGLKLSIEGFLIICFKTLDLH